MPAGTISKKNGGSERIRTSETLLPTRFRVVRLQPLGHASTSNTIILSPPNKPQERSRATKNIPKDVFCNIIIFVTIKYGTPDTIRTYDLWLRKPTLYPTELRVQMWRNKTPKKAFYLSTVQRLNVHHIPKGYNKYYYSTLSLKMVY